MKISCHQCCLRVRKCTKQKHSTRLLLVFDQAESTSILIAMADQQEVPTGNQSETLSQSVRRRTMGRRALFQNTESAKQGSASPHSGCVPLYDSDSKSGSETDGESPVPKKKQKSGPLHSDYDIDIQYSDDETDSIPSDLSDADSIVDDQCDDCDNEGHVILDSENRLADLEQIETVFNNFANVEDTEMKEIRTKLITISPLDKLTVLHSLSLPLDKLLRQLETDEVLQQLPATQTSGFEHLICKIDNAVDVKRLLGSISQHVLMIRQTGYAQLKVLGRDMFEYFFGDLQDDISIESYVASRINKMLNLCALNTDILNDIAAVRNLKSDHVAPKIVTMKQTECTVGSVQYSLQDIMSEEFDDDDAPLLSQITRPRLLHHERKSTAPPTIDSIVAWQSDANEQHALEEYKLELHIVNKHKALTQELCKLSDPFSMQLATAHLFRQIPNYVIIALNLLQASKCRIGTARKWAWDITQSKNRAVMKWMKQQHADLNSSNENSSSFTSHEPGTEKTDELVYFPAPETVSLIFRTDSTDERFMMLPIGWKIRDGCPSGIFQHIPQMTSNVKYLLLVFYGTENVTKFTENVNEFIKFNASASRIAKCGMFATVNSTATLRGIPICQMCYVVLTMGRAAQLKDVAKEIVWFCKSVQIEITECLLEIFNNIEHCGECYKDCDDYRKELDGGFIGPVDTKWRKKLKITDDDGQNQRAFQIIFEKLDEYKVTNIPQAVALVNETLNSPDDSEFKTALSSVIGNATAVKQSIQIALWWNNQRQKHMPAFGRSNKGLIVSKMANLLFRRIASLCGGHLLDPTVTVSDWDEDLYGPLRYKGTLRQFQIMNLIQEMRTERSNLLYILKKNGINPAAFYNIICSRMILAGRRNRLTIFSGPKRSGKSIVAGALSLAFDGARIPVDVQGGRDFKIDGAMTDQIGMVILEDVQAGTFHSYIDRNLRAHLDGDKVMLNQKMKETSEGTMRSCVITTNERDDSDSDEEMQKSPTFTLTKRNILEKRYTCVRFRNALTSEDPFIESLSADDILVFLFRYGLYPVCNQLYGGPVCDMSPCKGLAYGDHNPMCPLICSIHSNLQTGVSLNHVRSSATLTEYYEQVDGAMLGLTFDIKDAAHVCDMLKYQMRVSTSDITSCRDNNTLQTKQDLAAKIDHFIDYVWKPLCYSSAYMRGNYMSGDACRWAHGNILSWNLFKPHTEDNLMVPSMADAATCESPMTCVELCWSAQLKQHPRYLKFTADHEAFYVTDKVAVLRYVGQYLKKSGSTKRIKRAGNTRRLINIAYNTARTNIQCDESFNELWCALLNCRAQNVIVSPSKPQKIDMSFYD